MDVIVFERSVHTVHMHFMTLFQTNIPTEFWSFFPLLTTIPRTTSNCTSAWVGEQQVSGALTPDLLPLPFSWTGIAAVRAIPPALWWLQEQGSCIAARLLPAVQPLASWILAMPISHGLRPDRTQVTGSDWQWKAWLDCSRATSQISFIHLDPFRRIHFGSSKHTSSTLQRHFGFVWKKGKEATVNTQLLIVQYKKKEQCDQRGHSQLSRGYTEPATHHSFLKHTAWVWCWIHLRGRRATGPTSVNADAPAQPVSTSQSHSSSKMMDFTDLLL